MSISDDIRHALQRGADDALKLAALQVLEQAKRNAPVGDPEEDPHPEVSLKDAGRIEPTLTGGWRIVFDTPYAARQEFDQRLKHPRGGGARYLHRALMQVVPQLQGIVAQRVDAETRTGRISAGRSHHRRGA